MEYPMLYVEWEKIYGLKKKNQFFCWVPKKTLGKVSYLPSVGTKNTWEWAICECHEEHLAKPPLCQVFFLYQVFSWRHSATSVIAECPTENTQTYIFALGVFRVPCSESHLATCRNTFFNPNPLVKQCATWLLELIDLESFCVV
jgi:hypothetical protein